jgi:flagellar protein FliO/FliZ
MIGLQSTTLGAAGLQGSGEILGPSRLLETAGALLLVLGCIVAVAWIAQRVGAVRGGDGRAIKVVEVLSLGGRERMLLLECLGERLLIASSPAGVNLIHRCGAPTGQVPVVVPAEPPFAGVLDAEVNRQSGLPV